MSTRSTNSAQGLRWLGWWVVAALVVAALAFGAGLLVHSPSEAALDNADADVFALADVEEHEFPSETPTVVGTLSLGTQITVAPAAVDDARALVVTTAAQPGAVVTPGQQIVRVSGRPVLALSVTFSLYRDLLPGDEGDDVAEVQRALTTLGRYAGSVDGIFGPQTAQAVADLYAGAGASPAPTPEDRLAAVHSAQDALDEALDAKTTAAGDETATAAAGRAVDDARTALAEATAAAGTWLPMAEVFALTGSALVVSAAPVGTTVDEATPAATLRVGDPTVTARVNLADESWFTTGAAVTVTSVSGGALSASGQVSARSGFRAADTDPNGTTPGYDVTIAFDEAFADDADVTDGGEVAVTPSAATAPTTGLAVPVTALRSDGDGEYVLVDRDGQAEHVPVTSGVQDGGWILVTETGISAGDRVRIGGGE